jgi:hypothetical protein
VQFGFSRNTSGESFSVCKGSEVAAQSKSTTLFPIPIDLFEPFLQSEENLEKVKKKPWQLIVRQPPAVLTW